MAGWLSLALALPVVTFSAADFWRAAWLGLRQRTLTLEVPIALGLAAIYLSSVVEVVAHRGPGYCDSLDGPDFFPAVRPVVPEKNLRPARRLTAITKAFFRCRGPKNSGGEESVAISRLRIGDQIILRNGELLPADAKLVTGEACMDYSFVTGESEPVRVRNWRPSLRRRTAGRAARSKSRRSSPSRKAISPRFGTTRRSAKRATTTWTR